MSGDLNSAYGGTFDVSQTSGSGAFRKLTPSATYFAPMRKTTQLGGPYLGNSVPGAQSNYRYESDIVSARGALTYPDSSCATWASAPAVPGGCTACSRGGM